MGRWTQYDEDEYRLPEGMKRVGYDADTQRYTFRDNTGYWLGEPGSEFGGRLEFIGPQTEADEVPAVDEAGVVDDMTLNRRNYRSLLPFVLIIFVYLLFWTIGVPGLPGGRSSSPRADKSHCEALSDPRWNTKTHIVQSGDTCYDIAQQNNISLDELIHHNAHLKCEALIPSRDVFCLPN